MIPPPLVPVGKPSISTLIMSVEPSSSSSLDSSPSQVHQLKSVLIYESKGLDNCGQSRPLVSFLKIMRVMDCGVLHFSNTYPFQLVWHVMRDNKILLLGPLQHENPVQKHIRTPFLLWVEAGIKLGYQKQLHSMTHSDSFTFTFKDMAVSVTVYFKVECIIP